MTTENVMRVAKEKLGFTLFRNLFPTTKRSKFTINKRIKDENLAYFKC